MVLSRSLFLKPELILDIEMLISSLKFSVKLQSLSSEYYVLFYQAIVVSSIFSLIT